MIKSSSSKYNKPLFILYPGDYYATGEDCILGTVTGSCIVLCLYDETLGIGGMGHFIIPGAMGTDGIAADEIARIGIADIEYILGELVKLGGDRKKLKAKIFGAGYMDSDQSANASLSNSNIRFIHEYFSMENIEVERSDLGGDFRRKVYFSIKDGVVYRQILRNNEESSEFVKLEKEYIDVQFKNKGKTGKVILFE